MPTVVPVFKLVGAVAFVAGGLLLADGDPVRLALALLAAAGLVVWAVRDLVAPVRIAIDPAGVTVISGYAGRRHLSWREIEKITLDTRPRRGLRSEILEIDTGSALHIFSRYDLDAPPDEVAAALRSARDRAVVDGGPPSPTTDRPVDG